MNNVVEAQRFRVNRNVWKTNLTKAIVVLEDNLDQIYNLAGVKPHRIVSVECSDIDESIIVTNCNNKHPDKHTPNGQQQPSDYDTLIDEHFVEVSRATDKICSLISSVTEFDLPIPIHVLLRLASRLNSLRWTDYQRKISGSISRKYVYTKSINLIRASLALHKWISIILGTNILPFQTYINRELLNILEWTRTSNLSEHDQICFFQLRSQIFEIISSMIDLLSLNLGLEPRQLKTLIEVEIIDHLEVLLSKPAHGPPSINNHSSMTNGNSNWLSNVVQQEKTPETAKSKISPSDELLRNAESYSDRALKCLENLFIVYSDYLEAPMEKKLKAFVLQTCIKIYRDFERNVIGLAIRRQLIRTLEAIANRPYATSTTELAWHVFELAEKLEVDDEIRSLARRSIKVGLAHRPTIVSNFGVYSSYASNLRIDQQQDDPLELIQPPTLQEALPQEQHVQLDQPLQQIQLDEPRQQEPALIEPQQQEQLPQPDHQEQQQQLEKEQQQQQPQPEQQQQTRPEEEQQQEQSPEDDPQVQSLMSLFVDKPAD